MATDKVTKTPTTEKAAGKGKDSGQKVFGTTAPVKDPGRKPTEDDIGKIQRKPRETQDLNAKPQGEDRVWGVESRARWGNGDDLAELSKDAADAEALASKNAGKK